MQEIFESSMNIFDILEYTTNRNTLNESWKKVLDGNFGLVHQKLIIHKSSSFIQLFELIPVDLVTKKEFQKLKGILHINQNQSTSLNLSNNIIILVPPETSLLVSDKNTSAPLASVKNEWIILKISSSQSLRITNKAFSPLNIILLNK